MDCWTHRDSIYSCTLWPTMNRISGSFDVPYAAWWKDEELRKMTRWDAEYGHHHNRLSFKSCINYIQSSIKFEQLMSLWKQQHELFKFNGALFIWKSYIFRILTRPIGWFIYVDYTCVQVQFQNGNFKWKDVKSKWMMPCHYWLRHCSCYIRFSDRKMSKSMGPDSVLGMLASSL